MKRFLLLAALVGGLTFVGFSSTAKADGWHRGGYGHRHGYGWRGGYRPHYGYGYGYRPYVGPGIVISGQRFAVGVPYAYPAPVYPSPYGYGYGCGW